MNSALIKCVPRVVCLNTFGVTTLKVKFKTIKTVTDVENTMMRELSIKKAISSFRKRYLLFCAETKRWIRYFECNWTFSVVELLVFRKLVISMRSCLWLANVSVRQSCRKVGIKSNNRNKRLKRNITIWT